MPISDPSKRRAYRRAYYLKNREAFLRNAKDYYQKNMERLKSFKRAWVEKNREKLRVQNRDYQRRRSAEGFRKTESAGARQRRIEKNRERFKERYKSDFTYTILRILRYRLWKVTTSVGQERAAAAAELLGCSIEQFRAHIEAKFTSRMSWKNYGSAWHIDHIIPCSAFDLRDPKQQRQCFHYTNLRPLWARANIRKGTSVPDPQLSLLM